MASIIRNQVRLTEKQDQVFRLVLQGKMIKEVAAELNISPSSASGSLEWIRKKFGVKTTRQLIALARPSMNVAAELARLRADVAGFDAWRKTLVREIAMVTAQRDEYRRQLEELRSMPAVAMVLARMNRQGNGSS